jgi:hypothetical protein
MIGGLGAQEWGNLLLRFFGKKERSLEGCG